MPDRPERPVLIVWSIRATGQQAGVEEINFKTWAILSEEERKAYLESFILGKLKEHVRHSVEAME